ncbi:hypothetical protein [Acidovorax sp. 1608163]|uniref:hypothetical protein n=1 Tax=Acidovorax sp. 1608163 TaxID=2478662 RepID=UPI0013CE5CDB|nr:hypothetical protein [Acidovorax sp. 1608163]
MLLLAVATGSAGYSKHVDSDQVVVYRPLGLRDADARVPIDVLQEFRVHWLGVKHRFHVDQFIRFDHRFQQMGHVRPHVIFRAVRGELNGAIHAKYDQIDLELEPINLFRWEAPYPASIYVRVLADRVAK